MSALEAIDKELRELGVGCCVPIFWVRKSNNEILANGTITFVQMPEKLLAITAAHVFRGYQDYSADADVVTQVGDAIIDDLSLYLIAISDEQDIATLDGSSLIEGQKRQIHPLRIRRGEIFSDDEPIALFGFPGGEKVRCISKGFDLRTVLCAGWRASSRCDVYPIQSR